MRPGSLYGYNAINVDNPRPTTITPGKEASASQYMEQLHSGNGSQGKGKGKKVNPATHTVAPM